MQPHEFSPYYLPAAVATPAGHVDLMGIAPLEGPDLFQPVDYHHPEAGSLRLTRAQARHVILVLTHALDRTRGVYRD